EDGTAVVQEGPTRRALDAGATARGGGTHDSSRAPTPPPSVRLARARARRAQGDLRGAAKIYEALIATSPRSAPARAATVSLGQLYLELGQPKRALGAFERYLGRGSKGPLTEDAAYGRLRALRALGRTKSLKRHADRFLAEHPKSAYASRVQRWAE
ncbi:MAG: tetratricopeptide repeat protein, partial [Deltaproteobacteria bacterium]|nr:tetratricopeptide repeat protein [Deltaproteobacteria bacterium]